jgi:hypothetical protein
MCLLLSSNDTFFNLLIIRLQELNMTNNFERKAHFEKGTETLSTAKMSYFLK